MNERIAGFRNKALLVGGIALLICLASAMLSPVQFFRSYLWAYWLWLGAAIGCGQILMLQHLIAGKWGFAARRVLEAGTRTLAPMYLLVIPLLIGIPYLYPFAQPEMVEQSGALQHKKAYLNVPFFLLRTAIYFLIWWGIAHLLNKWAEEQDRTGEPGFAVRQRSLAAPGIILYSLAVTFAAIDWTMSLEPEFFSAVYPLIILVGQVLTALAVLILTMRFLAGYPPHSTVMTPDRFYNLGNLLLTFIVIWAYIAVSQLIIVWVANLPREITFYLHRTAGGWKWVAWVLGVFHYGVPFFLLLFRSIKRNMHRLAAVAAWVLFMRAVDMFWLVQPSFHTEAFHIHWLDFAAPVGVGGIWVALFLWQLSRGPVLPRFDLQTEAAVERADAR